MADDDPRMILQNTKQAEKEYLSRSGSSVWEQCKPFSPPGSDTLNDSAHMLHDFAVALLVLQPSPDDLILDLGAGACWCSDLLNRLNRSTVAVDISFDMLRTGQARSGPAPRAVAGDMETLPFRDGSFQKAICLSAIHHVPDIQRAVEEVARVLSSDGVALFSEPGEGHAAASVSTAAMESYGVLEQDIAVAPFMHQCLKAGFSEVAVYPLLQAIPGVSLTVDEWDDWTRLARSRRPRRALAKIGFGILELLGLGKRGALYQEALAISMVRAVRQVVSHHPIIVARKSPSSTTLGPRWKAKIEVVGMQEVARGETWQATVTATNLGTSIWRPKSRSGIGYISLGVQLLDADKRLIDRDHCRAPLPDEVLPGEEVVIEAVGAAPFEIGTYHFKVDLVAEGVTWFELAGSVPLVIRVVVR